MAYPRFALAGQAVMNAENCEGIFGLTLKNAGGNRARLYLNARRCYIAASIKIDRTTA
jgi:hypothetical protein